MSLEDSEQLPTEPDFAGDVKTADARVSLSDNPATSVSASHGSLTALFLDQMMNCHLTGLIAPIGVEIPITSGNYMGLSREGYKPR